jgi:hypothetical protein
MYLVIHGVFITLIISVFAIFEYYQIVDLILISKSEVKDIVQ